ncbi:MAG: helix-turn-helix transcriptional regulator [Kiritimatiellae bacterium]|nr:helix-turn-helix transcriptional regulator [Kiritimatiellia bacterium]
MKKESKGKCATGNRAGGRSVGLAAYAERARADIRRALDSSEIDAAEADRQLAVLEECLATENEIRRALPRPERLEREPSLMRFVRSYIRSAHGADCSLSKLAAIFKISKFRLAHLYRQEIGETVGRTVDAARAAYVRAALRRGVSRKAICRAVGLSSPSSLCNWRRRNMPP